MQESIEDRGDTPANAVKATLGPKGRNVVIEEIRCTKRNQKMV